MSKIRVLIVDDSIFIRKALTRIFNSDPMFEIAGVAINGKEAIDKVLELKPDVITLDIMMPIMNGIDALRGIMEVRPTPVLMLSQYTRDGAELTLTALELGAMDFVDKSATGLMDFLGLGKEIISKLKTIAGKKPKTMTAYAAVTSEHEGKGLVDAVAIGTSTGGPPALQMLLSKLPKDISFGLLIVQHMPHGFTGPLAKRLNTVCKINIKEAEDGDRIEKGLALVAPSGLHMTVKQDSESEYSVRLDVEPMNTIHRPSVDVLFKSVAENYGKRSIGVILTGMGSDGAKGIRLIKEKGGTTFAQDETTSTIFGMPKVAIEIGAIDKIAPITTMAEEILKAT